MELVQLSNSDLKVSPICLGTWQFNNNTPGTSLGTWNAQEYKVSKGIVDASIESGINFFDTAEAYQNSEGVLGNILEGSYKSRRGDLVIASKFGFSATPGSNKPEAYTGPDIEDSLNTSLRNLKTDYLDLYQVHWPVVMKDPAEVVATLKRLQSMGKIRYYGVSNFGPKTLKTFYEAGGLPVTNQLPYSLLWRAIEYDIIPECERRNLSILAYSPLAQGLLSGKYDTADQFPDGRRRIRLFDCKRTKLAQHSEPGCERQMFDAIRGIKALLATKSFSNVDHLSSGDNVNPTKTSACCNGSSNDIKSTAVCGTACCQVDNSSGVKCGCVQANGIVGCGCKEGYNMINLSVDWLLSHPQVASVIVGSSSPQQIAQICSTKHHGKLDENVKAELDRLTLPVKEAIGNNPDMWFTQSRYS